MATRKEYCPHYGKLNTDNMHMGVRGIWYNKDKEPDPVEFYQLCDREWQDPSALDESLDKRKVVCMLMGKLTEREQDVVYKLFVEEMTLEEIGGTQNVTRERIRQIAAKAIRKCKYWMREEKRFQQAMADHRERMMEAA